MNIVEFILQLQDGMSDPLSGVDKSSQKAKFSTDQLTEANKRLREATGKSTGTVGELKTRIDKLKEMRSLLPASAHTHVKEVTSEIKKLQKQLDTLEGKKLSGLSGMFQELKSSIPPMFLNPLALIGAGAAAAINKGMQSSSQKLDFEILMGEDSGEALFTNLEKLKGVVGEGVFDIGKDLHQSGVAVSKITPMITQLGEVAAGNQQKFAALGGAFGELQKEGKLTDSILSAMKSNGFDPLTTISLKTGESLSHLTKRLQEGKVSAEEVAAALQSATGPGGQFYGNLEKINNSPMGMWNQLIERISTLASIVGEALLPLAVPAIDLLSFGFGLVADAIGTVVGWLKPLMQFVQENNDAMLVLGVTVGAIALAVNGLTLAKTAYMAISKAVIAVQAAFNAVLLANPIGIVIGLIGGLVAGVMIAWNKFEGFRKVIYGVWETVKSVFTSIANLFKQIFSPIGEAIAAIKEGRWMDAAKEAGKLLFNISPIGIVKNVVEFSKGGGFDDVGQAYARGAAKGAESWAKSQQEKESASVDAVNGMGETDAQREQRERRQLELEQKLRSDKQAKENVNAISGGGVKNITITVGKMFETVNNYIENGTKQYARELERIAEEAVVRAIASASNR